jgi:hypothetical protein
MKDKLVITGASSGIAGHKTGPDQSVDSAAKFDGRTPS